MSFWPVCTLNNVLVLAYKRELEIKTNAHKTNRKINLKNNCDIDARDDPLVWATLSVFLFLSIHRKNQFIIDMIVRKVIALQWPLLLLASIVVNYLICSNVLLNNTKKQCKIHKERRVYDEEHRSLMVSMGNGRLGNQVIITNQYQCRSEFISKEFESLSLCFLLW